MDSHNLFEEHRLGFKIEKPEHWDFVPPAWSPAAQLKNASGPEDWIHLANVPFVSMKGHHDSLKHPYPTVQVCCRHIGATPFDTLFDHFKTQIQQLRNVFRDFRLMACHGDALVSGHRSINCTIRHTVRFQSNHDIISAPIDARTYVIIAHPYAFTLGMSCSAEPDYQAPDEFKQILSSVVVAERYRVK